MYEVRKEMSIFFEIDGPYKAMVIPASKEENKQLKKRYAVYHMNNTIAEIKGFEIKRRGELEILKIFQKNLFNEFTKGTNLQECYDICGKVAEKYLNILYSKAEGMNDHKLLELITEQKILSKTIDEYEGRKGVGVTCALRLAEQLGDDFKGKGIVCKFVISAYPDEMPVSQRAIPIQIFNAQEMEKKKFLRKWLKFDKNQDISLKNILDWKYYIDRLQSTVSKLLVIPSAMQKLINPVKSVSYPDWLIKRLSQFSNTQQINMFFKNNIVSNTSSGKKNSIDNNDLLENVTIHLDNQTFDIEDNNNSNIHKNNHIQNENNDKHENNNQNDKENKLNIIKEKKDQNIYDMNKQFKQWLKDEKMKWIDQYKQGKILQQEVKPQLQNMFKQGEEQIFKQTWHIIQIVQTDQKGIYKLWILLENEQLIQIKIKIPRIIYVNNYKQEQVKVNMPFKQVKKFLPREKKVHFLYEFKIDEAQFQQEYSNFDSFLSNPQVEGVYQTQIPLLFTFISQIGNICKFTGNVQQTNVSNILFEDLYPLFNYHKPYLDKVNYIPKAFLGHLRWSNKHIFIIKFQFQIDILILNNNVKITKDQIHNFKYKVKEQLKLNNTLSDINIINIKQIEESQKEIEIKNLLEEIKNQYHYSFVLLYQSDQELSNLNQIKQDIPVVRLKGKKREMKEINSLDWHIKLIEYLIEDHKDSEDRFRELIESARFGNIPVGNFENDSTIFTMDVFYSRIIKQDNCVSWYSNNSNPDLGGSEDDFKNLIGTTFSQQESIKKPGLYTKYCLEIDIGLLALNTICVSEDLKDLDKDVSLLILENDGKNSSLQSDELQQARTAFKYLRTLALGWVSDTLRKRNYQADLMVQNLHRWITSKQSKFYDPLLNQMLNRLFYKLYIFLLNRLMQLTAHIVFSDHNKIILSTNKYQYHGAKVYADFILNSILAHPLFLYLNLSVSKSWKILFFRDSHNYLGILDSNTISLDINISNYLPNKIQSYFIKILTHYIYTIQEFQSNNLKKLQDQMQVLELDEIETQVKEFSKNLIKNVIAPKLYQKIPELIRIYRENKVEQENILKEIEQRENILKLERLKIDNDKIEEELEEIYDEVISNEADIKEREQDQLESLRRKLKKTEEWDFQDRIGKVQSYSNSVLELINFLCEMFQYDQNIIEETTSMKKNCLKYLKMSYYSDEAKFYEPTISLILNDVYCEVCNIVSHVDVFKENLIINNQILCTYCNSIFDYNYIEHKFIKFVQENLIFYQIQDIYCNKCNKAKNTLLQKSCYCSGIFSINKQDSFNPLIENYDKIINNLKIIADNFQFQFLKNIIESIQ